MSIGYRDLRKGMAIELDGEPYVVVDYERSKMQQRAPVMRIRFKEIRSGKVVDRTFNGYDVKLTPASVDRRTAQYIYSDDSLYYFMDTETYDQFPMSNEQVGESLQYMVEQTTVEIVFYEGSPIALDIPFTAELKVTATEPGVRGDTAQGGTKPATLETGLVLQVPLFVNENETIKVDTRTGEYLSRV